MTDRKFTDNDVIKALECCTGHYDDNCRGKICPYENIAFCYDELQEDAIALINSQKAEIKRLTTLAKLGNMRANDYRVMRDKAKNARAEAIKEFAERLKANMSNIARMEYGGHIYFCVGYDLIDNLVKEMTEEHNESQNT